MKERSFGGLFGVSVAILVPVMALVAVAVAFAFGYFFDQYAVPLYMMISIPLFIVMAIGQAILIAALFKTRHFQIGYGDPAEFVNGVTADLQAIGFQADGQQGWEYFYKPTAKSVVLASLFVGVPVALALSGRIRVFLQDGTAWISGASFHVGRVRSRIMERVPAPGAPSQVPPPIL